MLTSSEVPILFAHNVVYFLIGRHFGFLPYFFPGAVAIWSVNVLTGIVRGTGNMVAAALALFATTAMHLTLCPLLVFGGLTLWMYHVIANVPGGQPIGGLERIAAKLVKLVARYLPGRRRQAAEGAS